MRPILILLTVAIFLSAHKDLSVEIETTYVDGKISNRIDNFLVSSDMELLSENFAINHLALHFSKIFYDNFLVNFAMSNHQHNGTYIDEASFSYIEELFDIKLGRSYSSIGFQNSHSHSLFVEKPLVYRIALADDLNDEGVFLKLKYSNLYLALEVLSGDEYPAKDSSVAYVSTIGAKSEIFGISFESKASILKAEAKNRYHLESISHTHSNTVDSSLAYKFSGDIDLYSFGIKTEVSKIDILFEYFYKEERGHLKDKINQVIYNSKQNGISFELVKRNFYNFDIGARYNLAWSKNYLGGFASDEFRDRLNLNGFTPKSINLSAKYHLHKNHSITFEYDIEDLSKESENRIVVSYKMNF